MRGLWLNAGVALVGTAVVAAPRSVSYEQNAGQFEPAVAFSARLERGRVELTPQGARFSAPQLPFRMSFVNAQRVTPVGRERLPGIANYLFGDKPARWRTRVPTFGEVRYLGVWPGVDVSFGGAAGVVDYDFHLAPGADPTDIRLRFQGQASLAVDGKGDVRLLGPRGSVVQHGSVRFRQLSATDVGLATAAAEVDPAISFSTFLGGDGGDEAAALATDTAGALYLGINSTSSPSDGGVDILLVKLDPTGSQTLFETHLGGGQDDYVQGLAVNAAGELCVAGGTYSIDFPVKAALQPSFAGVEDGYVAKLDATGGALLYSTYLGGTAHDRSIGVALDSAGSAYVVGETASVDFPTHSPWQATNDGGLDAFVARISPDGGALVYSTYLGGSGADFALGVAVDPAGNAYAAGFTSGPNFPTTSGVVQPTYAGGGDGFLAELSPAGALLASTYLAGGTTFAQAVAVDGTGSAYVAGYTAASNFPVLDAYQPTFGGVHDAWVARLTPGATSYLYATYLGGSGDDRAFALAVDANGAAYVVGTTRSSNFPTTPDADQLGNAGGSDAFVAILGDGGSTLLYATYLGGSADDTGSAVALGRGIYAAGATASANFPTARAIQPAYGGGADDAWLAGLGPPIADSGATAPDGGTADAGANAGQDGGAPPDAGATVSVQQHLGVSCGCDATNGAAFALLTLALLGVRRSAGTTRLLRTDSPGGRR